MEEVTRRHFRSDQQGSENDRDMIDDVRTLEIVDTFGRRICEWHSHPKDRRPAAYVVHDDHILSYFHVFTY
jgi:hypothetical protein